MALAAQNVHDSSSRYVADHATIEQAFKQFRDQRTKVQLRFEGVTAGFTATILDVTEGNLLLEDINPRAGLDHLRSGMRFSLACRSQGLYLYVDGVHSYKSDSERGIPYFWIKMPTSVLYQQRRKVSRVALPLRVKAQGARVRVITNGVELIGDILDLSAGGVRAQFCGQEQSLLKTDQELENCVLHIRDQLDLESQATVRHALLDQRSAILNCGLELTHMHVTDRRRLEQYVESLARKNGQSGRGR